VREPNLLSILTLDIDDDIKPQTEVIVGSAQHIYASQDHLYIANPQWRYRWNGRNSASQQRTAIFKFDLGDDVNLLAQGTVDGHPLNQFSFDEHAEHLRVATTLNAWGGNNEVSTNNVYVLNKAMRQVGDIEDIAPGERIFSTRFMGNRLYMVTFRQVDPLFVIDMAEPSNPTILGKLKIPGFSNYLHPYDKDHILGFGKEADSETGRAEGMKVALFDVSDVKNPKEKYSLTLGDRGTDSPLLWDHKALLFERDRNLLAFPITVYNGENLENEWDWGAPVFQGAYVFNISPEIGFQLKGSISHYDEEDQLKAGDRWYPSGEKSIDRIIRINSDLFTMSNTEIHKHAEGNLEYLNEVKID